MAHRAGLDTRVITQAAADLVDAEGLDRLSLSTLAARLGVRPPSLYNHIAGLEMLRRELALMAARDLVHRLTRAAVGRSGAAGMSAVADAYLVYAREHPGLYAALQRAPDPDDHELTAAAEEILAVLRAVLAPYLLSEEDTVHAIRTLRALADGFTSLQAAGGFGIPISVEESYRFAIRMLTEGLERQRDGTPQGR
jgi:AcrR family transcriptional regulator